MRNGLLEGVRTLWRRGLGLSGTESSMANGTLRLYPPPPHVMSRCEIAALAGVRLDGTCPVCGEHCQFYPFTENMRESGRCSRCGASNRQRQMAWMLRHELGLPGDGELVVPPGVAIYNTEANGPLHEILKAHPLYQCSEYWGDKSEFGERVNGVRNEDLQALSFEAMIFDVVLVVVIGGISLVGGRGSVFSVVVGGILIGTLLNAFTIMDVNSEVQNIIKGIVLLGAIVLDNWLHPRDEETARQGD